MPNEIVESVAKVIATHKRDEDWQVICPIEICVGVESKMIAAKHHFISLGYFAEIVKTQNTYTLSVKKHKL